MKKFYVTTSIPYVNAKPHIGHALEFVQADALARYWREVASDTREVFFLTGSDENGSKNYKTAKEEGVTTEAFVARHRAAFQELLLLLNITNSDFISTTDRIRHWSTTQKIWRLLAEKGSIYKANYTGYYCVGCEAYILEKELVEGKCPIHRKAPEHLQEENYFFRLSNYTQDILQRIEQGELRIIPESRKKEIVNVLKEGLQDVSFSRPKDKLPWGVPVPDDPDHVMYVWCDALTNYLSGAGYTADKQRFLKFWPADVHVIGKDIVRFHAAIWPGMLLAAELQLPKTILVHGFVHTKGEKMSKSLGNVVDPKEMAEKYGTDALRYYLLREIPTTGDGDFTIGQFERRYEADLANDLGNLFSRVVAMTERYVDGTVPHAQGDPKLDTRKSWVAYHQHIQEFSFDKALEVVWAHISLCNRYVDEQKPWEKGNAEQRGVILFSLLESLRHHALMLRPFLPTTSAMMLERLGASNITSQDWGKLPQGTNVTKGAALFPRLSHQVHL